MTHVGGDGSRRAGIKGQRSKSGAGSASFAKRKVGIVMKLFGGGDEV